MKGTSYSDLNPTQSYFATSNLSKSAVIPFLNLKLKKKQLKKGNVLFPTIAHISNSKNNKNKTNVKHKYSNSVNYSSTNINNISSSAYNHIRKKSCLSNSKIADSEEVSNFKKKKNNMKISNITKEARYSTYLINQDLNDMKLKIQSIKANIEKKNNFFLNKIITDNDKRYTLRLDQIKKICSSSEINEILDKKIDFSNNKLTIPSPNSLSVIKNEKKLSFNQGAFNSHQSTKSMNLNQILKETITIDNTCNSIETPKLSKFVSKKENLILHSSDEDSSQSDKSINYNEKTEGKAVKRQNIGKVQRKSNFEFERAIQLDRLNNLKFGMNKDDKVKGNKIIQSIGEKIIARKLKESATYNYMKTKPYYKIRDDYYITKPLFKISNENGFAMRSKYLSIEPKLMRFNQVNDYNEMFKEFTIKENITLDVMKERYKDMPLVFT